MSYLRRIRCSHAQLIQSFGENNSLEITITFDEILHSSIKGLVNKEIKASLYGTRQTFA